MKKLNVFLIASLVLSMMLAFLQAKKITAKTSGINKDALTVSFEKSAIQLKVAFPNLTFDQPLEFVSPGDGTNRNFVIAQKGKIHVFKNDVNVKIAPVFLDIVNRVTPGGERGLLGLAFHPDFKKNGYFYVNYTTGGKKLRTIISRFRVSKSNINAADTTSELVLLTYDQPYNNHNGGKLAFGKDGCLYISVGDGGSGGDPQNNGQNKAVLLGKILRIDVNKAAVNLNYSIPVDNPFKGNSEGFREEIFAYGLRNPWRFSFDKNTGDLWAGDVGQNKTEEIDIIIKGQNYGWKIMEADECFGKIPDCNKEGLASPVWVYQQSTENGRSVTGGYVYRGKKLKSLFGKYVYGDYVSGNIWTLMPEKNGKYTNALLLKHKGFISSFGEDANNELYVCSYIDGKIYSLQAAK
ncbi:MAG TPA: PQQ-dependent sugar dehydrogenase [Sphingobacteriaceae bacterium]|nr:PQQ-dependent sugar dehydrogenase [Sphingobacteriaceae bacterium]